MSHFTGHHDKLDKAHFTRNMCVIGLVLSWIAGLIAFGGGGYVIFLNSKGEKKAEFVIPHFAKEVLPLGINIILTFLNESMGYIHCTSLRWSLQAEDRLTFNSNLRLLSSSSRSLPNKWYSNLAFILFIVLSYATTSLIFLGWNPQLTKMLNAPTQELSDDMIHVSGIALVIFGISLLGQAVISTWALSTTRVPTWSSNPLDTVCACTDENMPHRIVRRNNRCMKSVHQKDEPPVPTLPKKRQGSAFGAHSEVRWVLCLLWCLVPLGGLWGGVIYTMIQKGNKNGVLGSSWQFVPLFTGTPTRLGDCPAVRCTEGTSVLNVGWTANNGTLGNLGSIFLIAGFQSGLTLALHCAELLVNLSRDESILRMATTKKGTDPRYNSILAAFTSWQTIMLFLFKAAVHWLFGLSINNDFTLGVNMYPPQIFYFTAFSLAVAIFATYVSLRRPEGSMPASFGHLQTMADLIDEWEDRMFWGHKAGDKMTQGPCFAGTSQKRLDPPFLDRYYGGTAVGAMTPVPVVVHNVISMEIGVEYAEFGAETTTSQNASKCTSVYTECDVQQNFEVRLKALGFVTVNEGEWAEATRSGLLPALFATCEIAALFLAFAAYAKF
ncbi:hypothetical protein G7Y89_g12886 [Cudoniella acicularis]|uniref:Uncharacterized protein n=1 Tax=Cudoniella acicularis TaxID=354080 RepID=A0A8H4RAP1_9HELO|nr:hypothetical protein G7Y89_g12886 [Cudoniella acicularis]